MKIVVTTLSLGVNYTRDYTLRMIEDILKLSNVDFYITTDCPEIIPEHHQNNSRIHIHFLNREQHKISLPIGPNKSSADFNFNIRYLCLEPVKDLEDTVVIFTDCDNSFDWWDENEVTHFLNEKSKEGYDFYGPRIEYKWKDFLKDYNSQSQEQYGIFWHKIFNYELDPLSKEWDNAPLPAEYLLIFDNRNKKLNRLYEQWKYFHDCLSNKETTFGTWAEGFEIGVSSYVAGFNGYDISWHHPIWGKVFCANGYKTGPRGKVVHQTER